MELSDFINIRHHLHRYPELSGQENNTSKFIRELLEEKCSRAQVMTVAETGVLVKFEGKSSAPSILLRCELDALAIHETNDFKYQSVHENISHKCGHDGHMTILLRVAHLLQNQPPKGNVFLLFQPAEENGQGAKEVLEDDRFHIACQPDYVYALHNIPGKPMHSISLKYKLFSGAVISSEITFHGKTAHAGEPENGINPSYAIAEIWQGSQELLKKLNNDDSTYIITPIYANIGSRDFGIAAGHGQAGFTLRAQTNKGLTDLQNLFRDAVKRICDQHQLELKIKWIEEFPAIENNMEATDFIRNTAQSLDLELIPMDDAFSWGEDFGHFTKKYKGAMFGLGAGVNCPALHNSNYDFPDELIKTGSDFFLKLIEKTQHD